MRRHVLSHLCSMMIFSAATLSLAACDKQTQEDAGPSVESRATTPEQPEQEEKTPASAPVMTEDAENGLITVRVKGRTVEQAHEALKQAIEGNEKLGVMATFDHTQNATGAQLELRPTRVVVFGNPNLGTPLMQKAPTMALDLPQRMLIVASGEDQIDIVYNDPMFLAKRHGVTDEQERLEKIAGALKKLAGAAAGAEPVAATNEP